MCSRTLAAIVVRAVAANVRQLFPFLRKGVMAVERLACGHQLSIQLWLKIVMISAVTEAGDASVHRGAVLQYIGERCFSTSVGGSSVHRGAVLQYIGERCFSTSVGGSSVHRWAVLQCIGGGDFIRANCLDRFDLCQCSSLLSGHIRGLYRFTTKFKCCCVVLCVAAV